MKTLTDPIIVAGAGPLIRLAAAGLPDAIRPRLMQSANMLLTMLTTRAFADLLTERGYNPDAARALESMKDAYNLEPAAVNPDRAVVRAG